MYNSVVKVVIKHKETAICLNVVVHGMVFASLLKYFLYDGFYWRSGNAGCQVMHALDSLFSTSLAWSC